MRAVASESDLVNKGGKNILIRDVLSESHVHKPNNSGALMHNGNDGDG